MNTAAAQNRVVVIPMAGDDVPAELTPTTPVAKINPGSSDYIFTTSIGNFPLSLPTVFDKTTGLEWQREDDNIERTWLAAWHYCADLDLSDHQDWRLPTVKELQSIVNYARATEPLINIAAFPNTNSDFYWTASIQASSPTIVWSVNFNSGRILRGDISGGSIFTLDGPVRCVR